MSKYLLILTTAAAIGASYLFAQSVLPTRMAENERTYEAINEMLADQLAASGLNEAAEWLVGSITMPTNQEFTGAFEDGGRYVATIQPNGQPNQVVVRSTGIVEGTAGYIERVREVVYELGAGGSGGGEGGEGIGTLPAFMSYSMLTEKNLTMSGNTTIGTRNGFNTNIHTNAHLSLSGNTSIYGFASYVTTSSISGNASIRPPDNPDNNEGVFQTDKVEIPVFNASEHQQNANATHDHYTMSGNQSLYLGTRENPHIIYIKNNINISGNTQIYGYGIFIVDGDISISGNTSLHNSNSDEGSIALYTSGNVSISGNTSLRGPILAGGNVTFSGNSSLCGSIAVRGQVAWSGNSINYCKPAPALAESIWPSEDSPGELKFRPISYRSW